MGRRAVAEVVLATSALLAGACGRLGFETPSDAAALDDAISGPGDDARPVAIDAPIDVPVAPPIDSAPSGIVYVAPFVKHGAVGFTGAAHAAGDAIVIQVSCASAAMPTSVAIGATGWAFTQLGPIVASTAAQLRSATVVAIAPDTADAMFTVTWSGSACEGGTTALGDEFAMTDPGGKQITFDSARTVMGTGNCSGSLTTPHDGNAVWAACTTGGSIGAVALGLRKGDDDGLGDWSAYKLTNDPANTLEPVAFANIDDVQITKNDGGYVLSMLTLKPR